MSTLTAYGYACCEWPGLKPIGIGRTPLDAVNDVPDGTPTDTMPTLPITEALYRAIQDGQMPAAATVLYDQPGHPLGFLCTIEEAVALDADDATSVPPMTCDSCFFACTVSVDGEAVLDVNQVRCRRNPPAPIVRRPPDALAPVIVYEHTRSPASGWCGEWREVPKG
ncbi:hypothetical protein UFOVP326_66 [uncultured Caudovirales phage]|uniref:Uncharacterized protein n=1 Tax=uncultured Caudovirales phage TaxID=2100421 RepID=A0A6J5LXT3_9CAUD|nr:hypothetical protein UFOVP326_66 [uncultured Caudovirales phage]